MSKKILIVIIALLVAVCGVSTYLHIKNRQESENNKKMYETVVEEVSATEESTAQLTTGAPVNPYTDNTVSGGNGSTGVGSQSYTNTMTSAKNPDMVGWIKINGTGIDYPVMQTKGDPDFYLTHDFYKNDSVYGCPYVQANCDVNTPSDNVIIYAHHMNDGSMFAGLENFNRTLPIIPSVREELLKQKDFQDRNRNLLDSVYYLSDYVCTFDDGKKITPNYLTKKFHQIISKHKELPQIRFHDLRHSVASNLLNDGFSTVQVAEWLGHSSSTTTLKFYAHIDKTSKMAIAEKLMTS